MVRQRRAELLALHGEAQRVLDQTLGHAHAHRGDMQTAPVQHLHGGLETLAFLTADNVLGGHPAVLEGDVANVGAFLAHLHVRLAADQPRRVAFNDKGGDAAGALVVLVGTRHHRVQAGFRAVGDVTLGAVENVVVAVLVRAGLQARRVGAHVRLGQTERADHFAGGQFGHVLLLLLFGAVDQNALGTDAVIGAEERAERRRGVADLKRHQGFLFHGQAQAAVLLGNRQTEQTHLFHFPGDVLGNGVVLGHGLLRRNQAVADETVDGIDELVEYFLVANHGRCSVVGFSQRIASNSVTTYAFRQVSELCSA